MNSDFRRILVTGGCGFIGSNFIRHVLNRYPDWQIKNLDKLTYAGNLANLEDIRDNPSYKFVQGDIKDRKKVRKLFEENNFDAVINFAAESHVDRSVLDPAPFVETNVKGTQVLLDIAAEYWEGDYEGRRFLQISTDEVYGELGESGKFTEESPLEPNSPYAASKASADMLCRAYHRTRGLPVIITRSSNNYGPYQFPEKLIPLMISKALNGEELPVYGKGREVRDWLYVEDNCKAIETVLARGNPGEIYNIGADCEKRNVELVRELSSKLNNNQFTGSLEAEVKFVEDPRGDAHDFRYALDSSKLKDLGWNREVGFEEGLKKTIDWYLKNRDWVDKVTRGQTFEVREEIHGDN